MIGSRVKEYLKQSEWTVRDILHLESFVENITTEIYESLETDEKVDLVWDILIPDKKITFSRLVDIYAQQVISEITKGIISSMLDTAAVSFNEEVEEVGPITYVSPEKEVEEVVEEVVGAVSLKERAKQMKDLAKVKQLTPDEMRDLGIL